MCMPEVCQGGLQQQKHWVRHRVLRGRMSRAYSRKKAGSERASSGSLASGDPIQIMFLLPWKGDVLYNAMRTFDWLPNEVSKSLQLQLETMVSLDTYTPGMFCDFVGSWEAKK